MLYYIEQVADGNVSAFARIVGINLPSVWNWCRGFSDPTLSHLLRLCYRLGISLRSFLLDEDEMPASNLGDFPLQQLHVQPLNRRKLEKSIIQSALESALEAEQIPPPSLKSVARQAGYRHPRPFYKDFPDLCYAISERYISHIKREREKRISYVCEQLRQAAKGLHALGLYPSRPRLSELGIEEEYFHLPEVHSTWRDVLHDLGYK